MSAPLAEARDQAADALARLWRALGLVNDERDRRVLLDCLRDALDRGSERLPDHAELLACAYLVEGRLGGAGAAVVLKARHRDLGTLRAIKTLTPERASDPLARRMLLREAKIHLAIRHPAVVEAETLLRLHDGRPALVLALVDGPSLATRLADSLLGFPDALALAGRLAEGLAAIHAAGALHLDLTPANVLLPGGDVANAKICDFGLARRIGDHARDPDLAAAFTHGYAAPEIEAGDPADPRADLFSLGAILTRATASEDRPEWFETLIADLCASQPKHRPRDTAETLSRLDAGPSSATVLRYVPAASAT